MSSDFTPTRTAALERLQRFLPKAGSAYASRRNYDLGPERHDGVSTLSPYIRHRLITEAEVIQAVLGRFSPSTAEKFIQEVYWRTYWKGWLEMRPSVWDDYQRGLRATLDAVQTQSGLRARWEAACLGQTGIACFDHWAHELVETGYLHNHARMWFASIWIFTLDLPWELGADFFLRHLLDGDPASNTLGWRWVGGIQTRGKTYLARPDNIAKYTEGRFNPSGQLARSAPPLNAPLPPDRRPAPTGGRWRSDLRTGLLITPDDLSPGFLLDQGLEPACVAVISHRADLSPLALSPRVLDFEEGAIDDLTQRLSHRLGPIPRITDIAEWAEAERLDQIVTPYAPVGPEASALSRAEARLTDRTTLIRALRPYDEAAWPHATHGFFRFKEKIPRLLAGLRGLQTV
ncbi:FAD-binding domain-containing protein [Thalassococcus sp. S3]|uniref:FAD-binding domain-containing protein n=1 Tax=Thalassococcus sp. S3 TaxID=2017482 RepID=UPI0010248C24|nr:FAD-binding domain-containing protein [Thalassococcus sp. S3]QBF32581.1 DNA photolyase [Thalassococcus sp. S3]